MLLTADQLQSLGFCWCVACSPAALRLQGDRMSAQQLDSAMELMDKEMTGEVDFNAFSKWWRYKKQEYRREIRKNIRLIFDTVDEDGSGELNKQEVKKLHSKGLKKMPGTIEFDPPFSLDTDFEKMQNKEGRNAARRAEIEANGGGSTVNFDEFETWFKERTGDDDPVLPVLPEYMVQKIQDMTPKNITEQEASRGLHKVQKRVGGFFGQGNHRRSGKELWDFLRPRLNLLVTVQKQWGSLHDVYGKDQVSRFEGMVQVLHHTPVPLRP